MGWGQEHEPREPQRLPERLRPRRPIARNALLSEHAAVAAWVERPSTGNEERLREAHRAAEEATAPLVRVEATRGSWPRAVCPGCGTEKAVIRGKFSVHDRWDDGVCEGLCPGASQPRTM